MKIEASFLKGADHPDQFPQDGIAEVAFIGRSNVGKSSLINKITKLKNLAKVSATPGKTKEINFFNIKMEKITLRLVDLPGFGFAKLSQSQKGHISDLIKNYISERENLKTLCLLNDCRRSPEEDELFIQRFCYEQEIPLTIIVTKCDKLSKSDLNKSLALISKEYRLHEKDLLAVDQQTEAKKIWGRILPAIS